MAIRIDANTMDKVRLAADLMTQQAKPVDIANAVRAAADGDVVAPLITTVDSVESFSNLMGKTLFKGAGGVLVAASLANDVVNMKNDIDTLGYVRDSTLLSAAASIAAGTGLLVAAVAAGTVVAPVAVIVGTVASIALGATALFSDISGDSDSEIVDTLTVCWGDLTEIGSDIVSWVGDVSDDFANGVNKTLDAAEAGAEYASDALVEFGQELKTEAQLLIDEATEFGKEWAEETWQNVIETLDKIEKAAIAADALVQAGAEEFAQTVENMVDEAQEVTEQIEQLGDSVAGMVVKTYLELAKRADELGDEAGEWVDSSIEKLVRIANDFGDYLTEEGPNLVNDIKATISDLFNNAQSAILRRDPLTLDLDGDGLETVGIDTTNPILFDHDGDGIKTATGWIKPDDGFLVLDRNGNGTIDNGTER